MPGPARHFFARLLCSEEHSTEPAMSNSSELSPSHAYKQLRARRLKQVLYVSTAGLLLATLVNWLSAGDPLTLVALLAANTGLITSIVFARQGQIERSATIMLWTLAICISAAITINHGLVDSGMLAFPAILIFAALFGQQGQFNSLFTFILLMTLGIGVAHILGWRNSAPAPPGWSMMTDVIVILFVIGYSVRFPAFDLRNALERLEQEIEKYRKSEATATYLAQYDSLTGLPNRSLCEDRFNQHLAIAKRQKQLCALLFIDLDNFKTINDSLGHVIGDQVLKSVANSLQRCIRATDTASRFGGDEFIVLLNSINAKTEVDRVATKILRALTKPVTLDNHLIQTSASIGIVLAPADGNDFISCCRSADIAMYQAKADGKNLFRFYSQKMDKLSNDRFALIKDLSSAIKNDELKLYYQPKIDLVSGQLVGAEALIRWQHPSRGLLPPITFIELAEETGQIIEIGQWILKQACQQCRAWHDAGYHNFEMAVNLSPVQFARGNLQEQVEKALKHANLSGEHLELEITESLLLHDADSVREQIDNLRLHGVTFSIDDFGTGYSNLGYLSEYDLESLKIDQSFVRNILNSKRDLNIVIAIINIAKSLELSIVAEGIEDVHILTRLTQLGCTLGQGYYWSKPLPADAFSTYMAKSQRQRA